MRGQVPSLQSPVASLTLDLGPGTGDRGQRTRAGFTLTEVLVALVVVTTAMMIVAQGFLVGGRGSVAAQKETVAAMLAESKLAEIEAGLVSMTNASSGTFEDEKQPDFSWSVDPEPSSTITGRVQVTVTVTWKEREQERALHLVRLMREATR